MRAHFVTFFSPGTFVAEQTTRPIEEWSPDLACEMVLDIRERHGATPYGFQFTTRERTDVDLDSKEVARSGMFYLGGKVWTVEELEAKGDPKDEILIGNMRCNKWARVVVNDNSWRWTAVLGPNDTVLPWKQEMKHAR